MANNAVLLIYYTLSSCFFISSVVAFFVVRGALRERRAEKLRKQEIETGEDSRTPRG